MKKSVLLILLAVLSVLLVIIKSARILHHHGDITIAADIGKGMPFNYSQSRPQIRPTGEIPTAASAGQEIEQAIRRRLDADAAMDNAPNYFTETSAFENRIENRRIVGLYTEMNPADAARILETVDTRQAVRLLQMMSTESAAAILSRMKLDQARAVTEQMLQETTN